MATLTDKGGFYLLPTAAQRTGVITYSGATVPDAARPGHPTYPFAQEGDHWIDGSGVAWTLINTVWVAD